MAGVPDFWQHGVRPTLALISPVTAGGVVQCGGWLACANQSSCYAYLVAISSNFPAFLPSLTRTVQAPRNLSREYGDLGPMVSLRIAKVILQQLRMNSGKREPLWLSAGWVDGIVVGRCLISHVPDNTCNLRETDRGGPTVFSERATDVKHQLLILSINSTAGGSSEHVELEWMQQPNY